MNQNEAQAIGSESSAGLGDLGRALVNATREKRGERPVFLCQLEIDPRDPSAIIEELTEERDRYKEALARLYNAAIGEGTMTIAELKELERMTSHMRNVKPEGFHRPGGWSGDTSNLLAALRNLAPELLELWEAANKFGKPEWDFMGRHGYMAGPDFHDALERLNAKAESMDA